MTATVYGRLSIDTQDLVNKIRDFVAAELEKSSGKLLEIMRKEVMKTSSGRKGRLDWRDEMRDDLKVVYREIANDYLEFGVGLPHENVEKHGYKFMRAMTITYGGGSQGLKRIPIHTKPGEIVWNKTLDGQHLSKATTQVKLPAGFNKPGNDFINNSMKIMEAYFRETLTQISARIPGAIFVESVTVTRG